MNLLIGVLLTIDWNYFQGKKEKAMIVLVIKLRTPLIWSSIVAIACN